MRLLAALCDIFDVTPNDLIEPYVATSSRRRRKTGTTGTSTPSKPSRNRPDPCGHQTRWGLTGCMASTIVHGSFRCRRETWIPRAQLG